LVNIFNRIFAFEFTNYFLWNGFDSVVENKYALLVHTQQKNIADSLGFLSFR
jgi:hypothetical protein